MWGDLTCSNMFYSSTVRDPRKSTLSAQCGNKNLNPVAFAGEAPVAQGYVMIRFYPILYMLPVAPQAGELSLNSTVTVDVSNAGRMKHVCH